MKVRQRLPSVIQRRARTRPQKPIHPICLKGYIESFKGKLKDELLNGEIFDTLLEAKVLIERCREE